MHHWCLPPMMVNRKDTVLYQPARKDSMQGKPWRGLWHLVGGSFFPVLAFFIPRGVLLITLGVMTAIFVAWEIVRFASPAVNRWMVSHLSVILKEEEQFRPTRTTYLLFSSLAVFLLFEKYVAITSRLFICIGARVASVIGE